MSEIKINGLSANIQEILAALKQEATRDKLRSEQRDRSRRFGIAIRGDGALTIPARFARMGAKVGDFADPVNFKFPVWLTKPDRQALSPSQLGQVRNAGVRFAQFAQRYDPKSRGVVSRRINQARKKFKIGEFAKGEPRQFKILAKQEDKQLVTGVVLKASTPDNLRPDKQGDVIMAPIVEETAHLFMIKSRQNDLNHAEKLPQDRSIPVESFISPVDFEINGKEVRVGDWVMTVKIFDPNIWKMVKAGEINAFSIKGKGKRERLT